jgi:predicted enzyme related to lactoylglutathione lyase
MAATKTSEPLDMKLEVVVIGVSHIDVAKAFYEKLGWRLDADFTKSDDFRVIRFTPHNSECSIIFGKGVTSPKPGAVKSLTLAVNDINAARRSGTSVSPRSCGRRHKRGSGCYSSGDFTSPAL